MTKIIIIEIRIQFIGNNCGIKRHFLVIKEWHSFVILF